MEKPVEAHMIHCAKGFSNLIGHSSRHDGIRRSAQACFIIEKFNPQDAKGMARVLHENITESWEFPLFWEDKELVNFCYMESQESDFYDGKTDPWMSEKARERKKHWHEWYMNRCVAHVDDVDIHADIWDLSPTIHDKYPSVPKMYMGTDIGAGWHNFKRESLEEMNVLETRKRDGL